MVIKYSLKIQYMLWLQLTKEILGAQRSSTYLRLGGGRSFLEVATAEKDKGEEGRSRKKEEESRWLGEG